MITAALEGKAPDIVVIEAAVVPPSGDHHKIYRSGVMTPAMSDYVVQQISATREPEIRLGQRTGMSEPLNRFPSDVVSAAVHHPGRLTPIQHIRRTC